MEVLSQQYHHASHLLAELQFPYLPNLSKQAAGAKDSLALALRSLCRLYSWAVGISNVPQS